MALNGSLRTTDGLLPNREQLRFLSRRWIFPNHHDPKGMSTDGVSKEQVSPIHPFCSGMYISVRFHGMAVFRDQAIVSQPPPVVRASGGIFHRRLAISTGGFVACLHVVPAIIIGSLVIMLIDNFTYTVFRWGIVKTNLYTVPVYWVLFLVIFIFMLRRKPVPKHGLSSVAITLLAVSLVLTVWSAAASPVDSALRGIKRPTFPRF